MKNIILSIIFIGTTLIGFSQVIPVNVTEYQLSIFEDSNFTQTDFIPFTASYIFDMDNNIITSIIDGNVFTMSVFTSDITDDNGIRTIGFTYNDFPHFTWVLNLSTREIIYREGYISEDRLYTFVGKF
jgi:hypothetical protein